MSNTKLQRAATYDNKYSNDDYRLHRRSKSTKYRDESTDGLLDAEGLTYFDDFYSSLRQIKRQGKSRKTPTRPKLSVFRSEKNGIPLSFSSRDKYAIMVACVNEEPSEDYDTFFNSFFFIG